MKVSAQTIRRTVACLLLASSPAAFAWGQPGENPPPTVPDTNVEAQPGTPPTVPDTDVTATPTPYNPDYFQDPGANDPVVQGDMFNSPLVEGYRADSSTAGSFLNVNDRDMPATVNSVTRDVLDDQVDLKIQDVLRNAGGTLQQGNGFFRDSFLLRGIQITSFDFRKDGFVDPTFVPRDFQNIERVDLLKGPASMLWGASSPAGMVNLVTKKPMDAQFSNFGFVFGAYNQARYTIDTNGRATQSGSVLYRVNAAQEDSQSFTNFDFLSRTLIAPTVAWNISDDTRLTYLAEYHRHHTRGFQGLPVIGGDPLALPQDSFIGEPANDFQHFSEFRQTLILDTQLNEDWSFRFGGSSLFYKLPGTVTTAQGAPAFPPPIPSPPPVPPPFFYRGRNNILLDDEQSQTAQATLAGDFDDFIGNTHQMVVGGEYVYFDSKSAFSQGFLLPDDVSNLPYNNPPSVDYFGANIPVFRQSRLGGYFQDLITVAPKWKVIGGVRADSVNLQNDRDLSFFGFPAGGASTEQTFQRISPRGGVLFQPFEDDTLAFYYNYTRSFSPPNGGLYLNPNPLKPILGEGHEIGMKTLLLPGLAVNVAGFHTTRQNADLLVSSIFLTQVGQERSQGAEVNIIGDVTDRLSLIANYTYTDVRLSDAFNPLLDGSQQRNVPYNSANFWSRYNFIQNETHTLGAALGMVFVDTRFGDLANTFTLPAYNRWDAGVFYNRGQFYSQLYVENLFDTYYAQSSIDQFQVFPGAPLNARAQIGIIY